MEEEIRQKQQFLYNEIIEGGFDPEAFSKYLHEQKEEGETLT